MSIFGTIRSLRRNCTLGLALALLLSACTRETTAQQAAPPPPLEEKEDDDYKAVKREAAKPGPAAVLMAAQLTRGSVQINQGNLPTWKVKLAIANASGGTVQLGESLVVLEERSEGGYTGVFVARERKPPAEHLKRFVDRYGLTWGVSVPPDGPGVWPLGALSDGSQKQALGLFLAVLSAPRPKAYRGGGYPSVGPRQQMSIQEEVLYPFDAKPGGGTLFVVAPAVRAPGRPASISSFKFEVGADPKTGQEFSPVETSVTSLARAETANLAADASRPAWRRVFALNWSAESHFEPTAGLLLKYAADPGDVAWLRVAAMLNLGLHRYQPGMPVLLSALEGAGDPVRQAAGIAALGELGDPSAGARIRPFLSSTNETIAAAAIVALGKIKDGESVPPLQKALSDKAQEKRHPQVAAALSGIGTQAAWDALLAAVADRKHAFQARRGAALALGEARYQAAVPLLAKILQDDRDEPGIRSNMLYALASVGTPDAWAAIRVTADGKDKSLALSAVQAMGGSKDPAQVARVVEIAGDAAHGQQSTALMQIQYRKLPGAGPTLRKVMRDPSASADMRTTASYGLKATGEKFEPDDHAALWSAFARERDRYARARLADALAEGGFSDKSRIPELVAGLDEDKNPSWFANAKLLRHLTGQKLGPENEYTGDRKSRKVELEKWRSWWAAQPR
jgi:HEAT repeat protein